jgi:hypothetical protein
MPTLLAKKDLTFRMSFGYLETGLTLRTVEMPDHEPTHRCGQEKSVLGVLRKDLVPVSRKPKI